MKLVWSFDAKEDMQLLYDHFVRHSTTSNAQSVLKRVRKTALLLLEFPRLGRPVAFSERINADVRMVLSGRIKIFYTLQEEEVRILRIWDTKQRPDNLLL